MPVYESDEDGESAERGEGRTRVQRAESAHRRQRRTSSRQTEVKSVLLSLFLAGGLSAEVCRNAQAQDPVVPSRPELPARFSPPGDSAGWLGLVLHARGGVAFVKRVVPGWPAAEAGLEPGDLIISVDGVMAQAPRLEQALDRLGGPAGSAVEVRVIRPGEAVARTIRAVRSALPTPQRPLPVRAHPIQAAEEEFADALLKWGRGDRVTLEQNLTRVYSALPEHYPALALRAVHSLLALDGIESRQAAQEIARVASARSPFFDEAAEACLRAFPPQDPSGELRALSDEVLAALRSPPPGVPDASLREARHRWMVVARIGDIRRGRIRSGTRGLRKLLRKPVADILALEPDGTVLWEATSQAPLGSREALEHALQTFRFGGGREALEAILRYDEPTWVYPALPMLSGFDREDLNIAFFEPRWPRKTPTLALGELRSPTGQESTLDAVRDGRPMLLLQCADEGRTCEPWRLALTTVMLDEPSADVPRAMIFEGRPFPEAATFAWPTWFTSSREGLPVRLALLNRKGETAATYGEYQPGLEQRVLEQLQGLLEESPRSGLYLVKGGFGLNQWDLLWSHDAERIRALAWSRPRSPTPHLWLLTEQDRLLVQEEGHLKEILGNLAQIERLAPIELDGDVGEELVLYHADDLMLEALDSGGNPRWIKILESQLQELTATDLDRDGRDELIYTTIDGQSITCVNSDGSIRWNTAIPGGLADFASGTFEAGSVRVATLSKSGVLYLLDAAGEIGRMTSIGRRVSHLSVADLDGDGTHEILVGAPGADRMIADDLNRDGMSEVLVLAGENQILLFSAQGELRSRMSWDLGTPMLSSGDLDGDGQTEVTVHTEKIITVLQWQGPGKAGTRVEVPPAVGTGPRP